jgi:hypothetical protein
MSRELLPFEIVFNPNWWYRTAGLSFDRSFYFDAEMRIKNDITMRRVLWERFGALGLGEKDPRPRPIVGSEHVAGGFIIPALLGAEIRFSPDEAPQALPCPLTSEQIDALEKPDFRTTSPMQELIADWDTVEARFGYLLGDLNTDGLLNAAYHFYGQALFSDFYDAPERVRRLLSLIGGLIADVAGYVRQRTGSSSIAVNRQVSRIDRRIFVHANCSVQMISPRSYRELQLPVEKELAVRMRPYGIHHCGDNLHRVANAYAELEPVFCDVGWGSDVAACRAALPGAFLNLRLSPIRMLQCNASEMAADAEALLVAAGPLDKIGMCCINMDYGTPDENILAVHEVITGFRKGPH